MEIDGRVIIDLPLQSGTSKAGNPWKKKEWVIETFGQYPKKVKVQAFGDRVDSLQIENGKDYRLGIDIESREFNGRWYTDVSVFSAREIQQDNAPYGQPGFAPQGQPVMPQQPQQPVYGGPAQPGFGGPAAPAFDPASGNADEDLPF